MDGFFIIIALVMVVFGVMFSKKHSSASDAMATKQNNPNDIPTSLKAKWRAEDNRHGDNRNNSRNNSSAKPSYQTTRNIEGQAGRGRSDREQAEETRRQTRRNDHRTEAQRKAMEKLGKGTPEDKNPNRRHDWGQRGHFGGGWVTPVLISLLSAAGVAALFAAN